MAEDSLNARRMNVNPGGKQAMMRPGWYVKNGFRFTQHMVFTGGPHKGLQKGLRAVCEERFGLESVKGGISSFKIDLTGLCALSLLTALFLFLLSSFFPPRLLFSRKGLS